jgi:chromosome segregation ATPase
MKVINEKLKNQQNEIENIKESNIIYKAKIEQLERTIKTQNDSINELEKDYEQFRNRIERCNDDLIVINACNQKIFSRKM